MNKVRFVTIGDIATDAFIRIKDAHVTCGLDKESCELCLRFGDKVPYESVSIIKGAGNSANVAVAVSRLGVSSAIISDVGDDSFGKESIGSLSGEDVNVDHIRMHVGVESNYHFVLWYDSERTILVKHNAYPYKMPALTPNPEWIYLSSVAENSENYHKEIEQYLEKNPEVKLAFQPGTFQIKLGKESLAGLYKRTEILFCNRDEANRILGREIKSEKEILENLLKLGPKMVIITDGNKGAYATDGHEFMIVPVFPGEPVERTGAGDAFSGAVMAGILEGKSLKEALLWGPINSASVIKYVGSQEGLLTKDEIEKQLSSAPEYYKIKEL